MAGGVQTSLTLQDRLTGPLTRMMRALDSTIRVMERMDNTANSVDTRGLQRARRDIQNASADLERLSTAASSTNRLGDSFQRIRAPVGNAAVSVGAFFAKFAAAAGAYLSLQALANGFKKLISASDAYVSTAARLSLINDETQTQAALQDKIYYAAQRSNTAYKDMADSVAKLNLLAGDAFSGNDEAIRFSELMGKSFSISGADTSQQQAGMLQLTQAMASGRLQGDEYVSILENAPLLAQAIADSMGVSLGGLKKLSSEGEITSDIIKGALFKAADDIESKFNAMPLTFSDAMTRMKNWALMAFEPILVRFNEFVNSDAFTVLAGHAMVFANVFIAGMTFMFDAIEKVYSAIGMIGQFFEDTWAVTGPILTVMGVVLGSILAILFAKYAILGLVRTATLAWAAAQWVVNAAFLANPITWILIAIIAVIALVVFAMIQWADQTAAVIGFIVGLFAAFGAYVFNVFANLWNFIAMFADFLVNLFADPVYAVKKLFYDLAMHVINNMAAMGGSFDNVADALGKAFVAGANIAITAINWVIKALNKIDGINISEMGKVGAGAGGTVSSNLKNMASSLEAPTSTKDVVSTPKLDLLSMPDAFNAGNKFGQKMSLGASNKLTGLLDKAKGLASGANGKGNPFTDPNALGNSVATSPGASNPLAGAKDKDGKLKGGKLDKVGKIDDDISIADEDLKMLKELADIRSIQNFRTLNPTVNFTGDMTIREDADIQKIIKGIETYMRDEMDRSTEGVYA